MIIIKSLQESGLLMKTVSKNNVSADEGTIRAGEGTIRASQKF